MTDISETVDAALDEQSDELARVAVGTECYPRAPMPAPIADIPLRLAGRRAWFQPDASTRPLLSSLSAETRCRYLEMNAVPGPERYVLGHFRVDEHREVMFEAVPALNYVAYNEIGATPLGCGFDAEDVREEGSVTERFLELSDASVPVPRMLIELDDFSDSDAVQRKLRKREIVEDALDAASVTEAREITNPPPSTAAAVNVCFEGGLVPFEDAYCTNTGINYCDNGAWHSLVRTSGSSRRRKSHSRTSSCQQTTTVFHFYRGWWFGWKWFYVSYTLNANQQFVPHGWYKYWVHTGGAKRRRKVERYRTGSPGFFRAWTGFYN